MYYHVCFLCVPPTPHQGFKGINSGCQAPYSLAIPPALLLHILIQKCALEPLDLTPRHSLSPNVSRFFKAKASRWGWGGVPA